MDTFPPPQTPLLTFPHASLTHHVGSHVFPLSSGPASLVGLEGGQLALTLPPATSVVIGKENMVRKVDQNEAHAAYAFNFAPSVTPSKTASSSSGGGMLPTNQQEAGGYLKLTLPPSKNQDQHEATTALSREFEALLLAHAPPLLDTRLDPEQADDEEETVSAVLSSWWTDGIKGIRDTAGVVYTGVREVGGGLLAKGTEVVGGAVVGKGKGREAGERAEDGAAGDGWDDVSLKRSPNPDASSTTTPSNMTGKAAVLPTGEVV